MNIFWSFLFGSQMADSIPQAFLAISMTTAVLYLSIIYNKSRTLILQPNPNFQYSDELKSYDFVYVNDDRNVGRNIRIVVSVFIAIVLVLNILHFQNLIRLVILIDILLIIWLIRDKVIFQKITICNEKLVLASGKVGGKSKSTEIRLKEIRSITKLPNNNSFRNWIKIYDRNNVELIVEYYSSQKAVYILLNRLMQKYHFDLIGFDEHDFILDKYDLMIEANSKFIQIMEENEDAAAERTQ